MCKPVRDELMANFPDGPIDMSRYVPIQLYGHGSLAAD